MIHILTTAQHTYTVGDYLKTWAGRSHPPVKLLAYETLPTILPRATYIFSDLERLSRRSGHARRRRVDPTRRRRGGHSTPESSGEGREEVVAAAAAARGWLERVSCLPGD